MPRSIIEPIPEVVESMRNQIFSCAKIEPWINCRIVNLGVWNQRAPRSSILTFVNDTFESYGAKLATEVLKIEKAVSLLVIFF